MVDLQQQWMTQMEVKIAKLETTVDTTQHYVKSIDNKLETFISKADNIYARKDTVEAIQTELCNIKDNAKNDKKTATEWVKFVLSHVLPLLTFILLTYTMIKG